MSDTGGHFAERGEAPGALEGGVGGSKFSGEAADLFGEHFVTALKTIGDLVVCADDLGEVSGGRGVDGDAGGRRGVIGLSRMVGAVGHARHPSLSVKRGEDWSTSTCW